MARKQQIIFLILFLASNLFLIECASQLSPPGGEKDIIPPTIISSYPIDKTIYFTENVIEFSFSEYVNKRDISEAFFISPLMQGVPEFSWTNKTVSISFTEKFKINTTYSVVIGTQISDVNNNNKMIEPYILTFSTGDKIDSGKISGKIYSDKPDGTLIFAYVKNSIPINIYKNKPDYVSQVDAKGEYTIGGLGNSEYEVFAVNDEFKDLIYNKGEDKIGISNKRIIISDSISNVEKINFFLTKEDTLAPTMQTITMTDLHHIILEFNEPIDSSKLSINNFSIIDSTDNIFHSLKYLYKGNPRKSEYVLCISDSLKKENNFYLIAKNIFDLNKNVTFEESINFIPSDKVDTSAVNISKINTIYNNNTIDYLSPNFGVSFTDAFDAASIKNGIKLIDSDSNNIPIKILPLDDASLQIDVEKELKPKAIYKIIVDLKYFKDLAGNNLDTILVNKVNTISNMEFSGVSGVVKSKNINVKIVLESVENKKSPTQNVIPNSGKFEFNRVMPGKYLLWSYSDTDSNNTYSYGSFDQNKFAEDFRFYPDTLNLRPRWPIGDIEINFEN